MPTSVPKEDVHRLFALVVQVGPGSTRPDSSIGLGITPNMMTMLGLTGNTVGAYLSCAWANADRWHLRSVDDSHRCSGWNDGSPAGRIQ